MKAILMLEDGHSFNGEAFGQAGESIGEVIFNTAVVGYQEMLTDPANAGKILVMTYPLIGNYGCAPKFNESKKIWVSGLVIKEKSRIFSNWQAKSSLDDFVKSEKLLSIQGIDTRTLTVHLRNKGGALGIISTSEFEKKELLAKIEVFRKNKPKSWLPEISVSKPTRLGKVRGKRVAILDLGVTKSVIKQLESLGFSLTLFPYNTTAHEILKAKPKGLVISGGPEQDPGLKNIEENIRALVNKLPILAISAGFQVLASSLGAKVVKMKLGHRGVNYPIFAPTSYKGEITCQNHSYSVDAASLNKIKNIKITANNLNDRTVEEVESKKMKIIAIQYNPSSPGFNEVNSVFKRFGKIMEE
ncbi:MAG: glutamine-hydrolyzing carbamoyl-phosphate synthase small subunit [Candidatus Omnitrophota bacterium]|nr:glutamine-hydrolyzing carbamoyl-phosphate synthase small subunit [Candidatus Omnitrophota bacterium]MBU1929853.1 glutamine-hydrolyzing carbamoyl-phosphate synthase small subunit [Candidatus Omnitrophota bacterium]MBU2034670.1 glutamine-hydrolyzing carbamoyl-phosphate synthase small subunit [Candidatus Omnitrophota bacterium]MBU2221988.1 glutamine-hydrolyzing carbamoyl-phosphate synthase small subunit [Candidatus Omnitrophota bacterium]